MRSFWWLIIAPLLDLLLLTRLGGLLGGRGLALWILIAALVGCAVIRYRGAIHAGPVRRSAGASFVESSLNLLAGLLLIFPGPFSDLLALILLFPPCRQRIREKLESTAIGRAILSSSGRARPESRERAEEAGAEQGEFPGARKARDVDFQTIDRQPPSEKSGA